MSKSYTSIACRLSWDTPLFIPSFIRSVIAEPPLTKATRTCAVHRVEKKKTTKMWWGKKKKKTKCHDEKAERERQRKGKTGFLYAVMMAMVHETSLTPRRIHARGGTSEIKAGSSFDLMPARGDIEKMRESNAWKSGTCAKTILQCATVMWARFTRNPRWTYISAPHSLDSNTQLREFIVY